MSKDSSNLWAAALNTLNEEDRELVAFDGQHQLDVLSSLGQLVASAKENSIKKRWRFHRPGGGQTVILRDLFSKIAVWIHRFKGIGDIVVQFDPVHAALPWAGVRFLLQIAVSDINKFAFIVEGVEIIAHTISRYAIFEQIYLGRINTATHAVRGLKEALVRLYAVILNYLSKAKSYFEEHSPKRMAKAVVTSQSGYEALLHRIDNEQANIDRHAHLADAEHGKDISESLTLLSTDQHKLHTKLQELLRSIDSPICRMNGQLDSLKDQLKHSERVEILRWLSSQPYLDHHQQIKKQALSGSGQWLLQDPLYIQWYKQSVSSLLWLHGKPGSGKSTLVSLVIEDMMKRCEAGQSGLPVYFYCTRSAAEPECSNPDAVLASILRQLSCVKPDAPLLGPVIEKYRKQGEGFKSKGLDLDDSRELITRLIEDYSMTTIVVDALDECNPLTRQSLLDAFEHILKESAGLIKIFVSSRNDQDIVCTLRDYPNMNISSNQNAADIESYVKTETMRLVKKGQLLRHSRAKQEMTASIIEQVSGGADGMFRWASLQLDVLRTLKRDEDVRTRLGRLPPKLEQLYLEVYDILISDSSPGDISQSIIDNALKWLLCAQEELRSSEFLTAVAANLDISDGGISIGNLLELCNNFVVYDEGLDVFRFAHLSVREFLEKKPEFAMIACNTLAAECCLLQIIASSNSQNTEHLMSGSHLLRLRGILSLARRSLYTSFPEHANKSWMKYCRSIPPSDRSDITKFGRIFWFLHSNQSGPSSPLNAWVQWYCSRVPSEWDSAASKLQSLLTGCSDYLLTSFFLATCYGFSDIVKSCVRDPRLSDKTQDQGLLLAAMAAEQENFDILSENRENWTINEASLLHAVHTFDRKSLIWLLEKAPKNMITPRVFAAVARKWDDVGMITLLEKYPGVAITQEILEAAVEVASLDDFRLLVARSAKAVLTVHMMWIAALRKDLITAPLEKIMILVDRTAESDLTPNLMEGAAHFSDDCVIEAILKKSSASKITDDMVFAGLRRGSQTFHLVLQHGGKITDPVLDRAASRCDSQAWQLLLEKGYGSSINVKRLKLATSNHELGDAVLSILLDHADDLMLASEMNGLIREAARNAPNARIKLLLNHTRDVQISQDMLQAALLNTHSDLLVKIQMFLERLTNVHITEDMLVTAAGSRFDGLELIRMFMDRDGEAEISKYVFMAAAGNCDQGYQIMKLLLEQKKVADLTEDVLMFAAQKSSPDLVLHLLERSEVNMGCLLTAAAVNHSHGGKLVDSLLGRAKIAEFPEDVFIAAMGNAVDGTEVVFVLEERCGRINVTANLMAKCVSGHRLTWGTSELLLYKIDPTQITKEILISALRNRDGFLYGHFQCRLAEKSLHIPVTIEILKVAAEYGTAKLFRFFWDRCRMSSFPEDLTTAAAKNRRSIRGNGIRENGGNGIRIMEFLLNEVVSIEIGEETMIAIISNRWAHAMFDLLLQQGLQADTTVGAPTTFLTNGGIKVKCSFPTKLRLSNETKVTEDMFRITASRGNEGLLAKLSKFCKLESVPEKWLDVARLHHAVISPDYDLLETLLERGVEHDFADPDGNTLLMMAAKYGREKAVQILLSAGASPDGGPGSKRSPLCSAAEGGYYEMVKMLVNAGASINFRDHKGKTSLMLAKENGQILVLKYLEQCAKDQEGRQSEISNST